MNPGTLVFTMPQAAPKPPRWPLFRIMGIEKEVR